MLRSCDSVVVVNYQACGCTSQLNSCIGLLHFLVLNQAIYTVLLVITGLGVHDWCFYTMKRVKAMAQ